MNLWLIFLTGLTTGGVSCVAMQGGLLASMVTNTHASQKNSTFFFLFAKLVAYTVLGLLLGWLGSLFSLSLGVRLTFQVLAALFMFATAMNLLEIHPIFRFVVLTPPKFLQRAIRKLSKSETDATWLGPLLLGLMTVFIPCGVTQAMEVVAITSGSPLAGALIMVAFVLGTMPMFALIGVVTAKLSAAWNTRFLYAAAVLLLFMSFYSVNGVLTVIDAPITAQKIGTAFLSFGQPPAWYGSPHGDSAIATENGIQTQVINITSGGYSPNAFTVKAGIPVELKLKTNGAYSCAASFTFRKFNIFTQLGPTDEKTVAFTPTEKGDFVYTCSMGMYRGVMKVI